MSEDQIKECVDNVVDNAVDNAIENAEFEKWVADLDLVFDPAKSLQTTEERRARVEELSGRIMYLFSSKKSTISNAEIALLAVMQSIKEDVLKALTETCPDSADLRDAQPDGIIVYQRPKKTESADDKHPRLKSIVHDISQVLTDHQCTIQDVADALVLLQGMLAEGIRLSRTDS